MNPTRKISRNSKAIKTDRLRLSVEQVESPVINNSTRASIGEGFRVEGKDLIDLIEDEAGICKAEILLPYRI